MLTEIRESRRTRSLLTFLACGLNEGELTTGSWSCRLTAVRGDQCFCPAYEWHNATETYADAFRHCPDRPRIFYDTLLSKCHSRCVGGWRIAGAHNVANFCTFIYSRLIQTLFRGDRWGWRYSGFHYILIFCPYFCVTWPDIDESETARLCVLMSCVILWSSKIFDSVIRKDGEI